MSVERTHITTTICKKIRRKKRRIFIRLSRHRSIGDPMSAWEMPPVLLYWVLASEKTFFIVVSIIIRVLELVYNSHCPFPGRVCDEVEAEFRNDAFRVARSFPCWFSNEGNQFNGEDQVRTNRSKGESVNESRLVWFVSEMSVEDERCPCASWSSLSDFRHLLKASEFLHRCNGVGRK